MRIQRTTHDSRNEKPPTSSSSKRHERATGGHGEFSPAMQTLPLSEAPRSATASEFLRRVLRFQHMDFEYTVWQMLYLCVNPTRIYRTTTYHSRTKHQWARDDPAFVVLVLYLLLVAALSWCLAFGATGVELLTTALYVVGVDFFVRRPVETRGESRHRRVLPVPTRGRATSCSAREALVRVRPNPQPSSNASPEPRPNLVPWPLFPSVSAHPCGRAGVIPKPTKAHARTLTSC